MKSLFIFEPHKDWSYCGGTVVILAMDWNDCQFTWEKYKKELEIKSCEVETGILYLNQNGQPPMPSVEGVDMWVLSYVYQTNSYEESKVLICNYNYG